MGMCIMWWCPVADSLVTYLSKWVVKLLVLEQAGDWEQALEKYNASREEAAALATSQAAVMENRAMSLAEGQSAPFPAMKCLGLSGACIPCWTWHVLCNAYIFASVMESATSQQCIIA